MSEERKPAVGKTVRYRDKYGATQEVRVTGEWTGGLELVNGAVLGYPFRDSETIFLETGTRWPFPVD